jgi:hypothetical protein
VLVEAKPWAAKQYQYPRIEQDGMKSDTVKPMMKLGNGDFWKDRQLRDYRRANNLCFRCGEKYDPAHQCNSKKPVELHHLEQEDTPEILSEEVLNMMEMHDLA